VHQTNAWKKGLRVRRKREGKLDRGDFLFWTKEHGTVAGETVWSPWEKYLKLGHRKRVAGA